MAFSSQADGDDIVSDINITPLVDVMLVLLVVFIVTAPLLSNAVKITLPTTAPTTAPEPDKAISVTIDAQSAVHVDADVVAAEQLESTLRSLRDANPNVALHLRADEAVPYGTVARAMASIERAGISKISVLTIGK